MFDYNIILQESTVVTMSRKRISLFLWQFVKVKSLSFLSVRVFLLHFSPEDICLSFSHHFIGSLTKYILILQMDLPNRCYSKDFCFNGDFLKKIMALSPQCYFLIVMGVVMTTRCKISFCSNVGW